MKVIMASRCVLEEVIRRTEGVASVSPTGAVFLRGLRDVLQVSLARPDGGSFDVPARTNWTFIRSLTDEFELALRAVGGEENLVAAKELADFRAYGDSKAARV